MELKELVQIVKTGDPKHVKLAQKEIEHIWRVVQQHSGKKMRLKYEFFLAEMEHFEEIKDADHKAYFINTLKWPFIAIGEENFAQFIDFILSGIQNSSGKVRQATLSLASWLIFYVNLESDKLNTRVENKASTLEAKNWVLFFRLVHEVEILTEHHFKPTYARCKYISSLPVGVYKSLQYLTVRCLLCSDRYVTAYGRYLERSSDATRRMTSDIAELKNKTIEEKRSEIEAGIKRLLKAVGSEFKLDDLKQIIYEEQGTPAISEAIALFDIDRDDVRFEDVVTVINDAWNYFPHKSLGGLAPIEKFLEYKSKEILGRRGNS